MNTDEGSNTMEDTMRDPTAEHHFDGVPVTTLGNLTMALELVKRDQPRLMALRVQDFPTVETKTTGRVDLRAGVMDEHDEYEFICPNHAQGDPLTIFTDDGSTRYRVVRIRVSQGVVRMKGVRCLKGGGDRDVGYKPIYHHGDVYAIEHDDA